MSIYTAGHLRTTASLPRGVFAAVPMFYGTQNAPQNLVSGEIGTVVNGPASYASTVYGDVPSGDESTDVYFTFGDGLPNETALSSSWSIALHVQMTGATNNFRTLAAIHAGGSFLIAAEARAGSRLIARNTGGRAQWFGASSGEWEHVVMRMLEPADAGGGLYACDVWSSGVLQERQTFSFAGSPAAIDRLDILAMGAGTGDAYRIADVVVADVAWTEEEIASIFASPWAHYEEYTPPARLTTPGRTVTSALTSRSIATHRAYTLTPATPKREA